MVCHACGTRNLPDAPFCSRCGARLQAVEAPETSVPPSPTDLARIQAEKAQECLATGDLKCALELARSATMAHPSVPITHVALGDVYMAIDAPEDALNEFRAAIELDPDQPEVREKAEAARRTIARPSAEETGSGLDGFLEKHGRLVPIVAGIAATLLVFTIGAAAVVSRTSPEAQRKRAFKAQMKVGSELYADERYAEAAAAFEHAARLGPDNAEASRRAIDAWNMAGMGRQVASANLAPQTSTGPTVSFQGAVGPPAWVGPRPGANAPQTPTQGTSHRPPVEPPPVLGPSPMTDATGHMPPLPPPETGSAGSTDDPITGTSRLGPGPTTDGPGMGDPIGAPVGPEAEPGGEPEAPATPGRRGGHIVIEMVPRPQPAEKPTEASASPSADAVRAEATKLKASGRLSDAAGKFAEAATLYRADAAQGGPDASTKQQAAKSCERARQACEIQTP